MATSNFLAMVVGWYLVIVSLFLLFNHDRARATMLDAIANRPLFFVMAIITIILGLIMVASHNVWVKDWTVVITVLSWMVLVSGLLRLFVPEKVIGMGSRVLAEPSRIYIMGVIFLIVGVYLLAHVYRWI